MSTLSLLAFDPESVSWGCGVQSNYLAVGAIVPLVRTGVGAVVAQGVGDPNIARRVLDGLSRGRSPGDALEAALHGDPLKHQRQLAVLNSTGQSAAFTGDECRPEAKAIGGDGVVAIGNLAVEGAIAASLGGFVSAPDGALARRLLAGMLAGSAAGGDRRGALAAGLLVGGARFSHVGAPDRAVDLRADASALPLNDLARMLDVHELYYDPPSPAPWLDRAGFDDGTQALLSGFMKAAGESDWRDVFESLNLAHRYDAQRDLIDPLVPSRLRSLALSMAT